jgi:prevent-host-death family protein
MKKVSYQDLKRELSRCLDEASSGEELLVTRHNKPVALLVSARRAGVHVGSRHGKGAPRPAFSGKTKGVYLDELMADRRGEGSR